MNLELREKVARLVFGWQRGRTSLGEPSWLSPAQEGEDRKQKKYRGMWPEHRLPAYETDIVAAWQVVGRMRERGYVFFYLSSVPMDGDAYRCKATFAKRTPLGRRSAKDVYAHAATAPLAICLAAVAAIESETK